MGRDQLSLLGGAVNVLSIMGFADYGSIIWLCHVKQVLTSCDIHSCQVQLFLKLIFKSCSQNCLLSVFGGPHSRSY